MSEWCWAATVSNVFAYHGHPVSQDRIVKEVYGGPGNFRSGPYSQFAALLDRSWVDDLGRPFTSRLIGLYDSQAQLYGLNNDTIRDSLDRNDPLVIGTTEHAMLVVRLTYVPSGGHVGHVSDVGAFDPWPLTGLRSLSATEATMREQGGTLMFAAVVNVQ